VETVRTRADECLKRHWGYDGFRPGQWDVIAQVLAGRDALIVLPTGGGKSMCYQLPALLFDGLTIVVSPLIALMQDQVDALKKRGISAASLHSQLTQPAIEQIFIDAEFGRYRLLYMAPERFQSELFQARAGRLNVACLAIDEAHCISEWGYDFRPAYLAIPQAYPLLGHPPVVALTATATPDVRRDIAERLALRDPYCTVQGFDRPNIVWSVFQGTDKRARVKDVLAGVPGCGVVYAATRRGVEQWSRQIAGMGISVSSYHGGMEARRRETEASAWLGGKTRVMVATNAFGMGIDHPGVRFVVHVDLPATLEGYYQEAGRGGRDGARAYAVLLYDPADEATQRGIVADSHPEPDFVAAVYAAVCNRHKIATGSLPETPVPVDEAALAAGLRAGAGKVRAALDALERQGLWTAVPAKRHIAAFRFLQQPRVIREDSAKLAHTMIGTLLDHLLRIVHADAFSGWWDLDLRSLERALGATREEVEHQLDDLQERHVVAWQRPGSGRRLQFSIPRPDRLRVDGNAARLARQRAESRLKDMVQYARSEGCRRRFLLAYFGEDAPDRCGQCDYCMGRHGPPALGHADETLVRSLLAYIRDGRLVEILAAAAPVEARKAEVALQALEEEGMIVCQDPLLGVYALSATGARRLDALAGGR